MYIGVYIGRRDILALRLRYNEENVAREPIRTLRYANGTTRVTQSTMVCMIMGKWTGIENVDLGDGKKCGCCSFDLSWS